MGVYQLSFYDVLRKQKYQLIGDQGAVKKCRWLHRGLTEGRECYKGKFYGIESYRCIQLTPTLACNLGCLFCWRTHPEDVGYGNEIRVKGWDEPEPLVEEAIQAQRRILSGYWSQVLAGRIPGERYQRALNPCHAAISLDGEPTLYPYLGSLIREFKSRGFTVFLVTNGTRPTSLSTLAEEPSQLYLSLYASDPSSFDEICKPHGRGLWKRIVESIHLLPSFSCPTVLRLTLVKGYNMDNPDEFGNLLEEASPTYIEAKAYMYVGSSRLRLKFENMPHHRDVQVFSRELADATGYTIVKEDPDSRVVLLSKSKKVSCLR